jgi:hypothetical protein
MSGVCMYRNRFQFLPFGWIDRVRTYNSEEESHDAQRHEDGGQQGLARHGLEQSRMRRRVDNPLEKFAFPFSERQF